MHDAPITPNKPAQSSTALITRAVLWVLVAVCFLAFNVLRIVKTHALGLPIGWWVYIQTALWLVVLIFWASAGLKQWTRRNGSGKVV